MAAEPGRKRVVVVAAAVLAACAGLRVAAGPAANGATGLLAVSGSGHYFIRNSQPFFWLGDTAWPIFSRYTREEAEFYLERRRAQGFTVVQTMLAFNGGPGLTTPTANQEGQEPWLGGNPATPNEAYFRNVDAVIGIARQKGLVVSIMPCGGSSGAFVNAKKVITRDNVRAYGRWLGQRYKDVPNIFWVNGFDRRPWENEDIARELAAGLREGDGGIHLMSYHPSGGQSSDYFHLEPWLAANIIQTWSDYWHIYPLVLADYYRPPFKPVIMAEGAYEEGPEYPSAPITPLAVRKQAYWSYLAGGAHTYGHNDVWRKNPGWRGSLDSPGARQMTVLARLLTSRPWWTYEPDPAAFAWGANGEKNLNAAARAAAGDGLIVYLASPAEIGIRMDRITSSPAVRARWFNPETGEQTDAGEFPSSGVRAFTSPRTSDAVLLLDAVTKTR